MLMNRFELKEAALGKFKTIQLIDNETRTKFEVALKGATPLSFDTHFDGKFFSVLDGFLTAEELDKGSGARNWIMTPFANRIRNGKYFFNGEEYQMQPVPPRNYVIHGYTSHELFEIDNVETEKEFIKVALLNKSIRPYVYKGYPFSLDVRVTFILSGAKVTINVAGKNTGCKPLPFFCGWHPYFKTSDKGIEHLILTVDAQSNILMDNNYLPLDGDETYSLINDFPKLNFLSRTPQVERTINGRIIDNCFAKLKFDDEGIARSFLFDPENNLEITLFQKGGVTLVFTGDTLKERKRKSLAIEPMQSLTNTFNRSELIDQFTIVSGNEKSFYIGFVVKRKLI